MVTVSRLVVDWGQRLGRELTEKGMKDTLGDDGEVPHFEVTWENIFKWILYLNKTLKYLKMLYKNKLNKI